MTDPSHLTPNERTRRRKERRKRAKERNGRSDTNRQVEHKSAGCVENGRPSTGRQKQLLYLFQRQKGRCAICNKPAILDGNGGATGSKESAVRFRTGSSYGKPGRTRPRVMAHRGCADARSAEITDSIDVDELRYRARAFPVETYSIVGENADAALAPADGSSDNASVPPRTTI